MQHSAGERVRLSQRGAQLFEMSSGFGAGRQTAPAASQTCPALPSFAISLTVRVPHHEHLCPHGLLLTAAPRRLKSLLTSQLLSFIVTRVSSSEMAFVKNQSCYLNHYSDYLQSPLSHRTTLSWDFQHPCCPQPPQPRSPAFFLLKGWTASEPCESPFCVFCVG